MVKKVTISDLVRVTGYSKSTISYALNNKKGVSEKVRKEIINKANELGYFPNELAKNISSGNYRAIGVILRDLTNPFYANVFCALDKIAEENNYQMIFYNLAGDSSRISSGAKFMRGQMVSGIILDFFGHDKKVLNELKKAGIPTVIFGYNADDSFSSVQADDSFGAKEAVKLAYQNGIKNIFYVSRGNEDIYDARRLNAVKEETQKLGLVFSSNVLYYDEKRDIADDILKKCPEHSLLICYNDALACEVIKSLTKEKVFVPDNYSIIGFDNLTIIPYSLTSIDIPKYEMAEKAFELLIDQIENNAKVRHVDLKCNLIIRDSVKLKQ